MRFATPAQLLLSALFAVGCTPTYTFEVAVRNETAEPMTVGVAKEGGNYEPQWASPEQAAMRTSSDNERAWTSVVVPPGKTGVTGPVKGTFPSGAGAYLRVYAGDLELSDVLALSRDSPDRVDVLLMPGRNAIIIRREDNRLTYESVKVPPTKTNK